MRQINERGLALVKEFESCRLKAYRDGEGVPTIGWGHTLGVKMGDTITQCQADEMLRLDMAEREAELNRLLGDTPTTSDQFSAMMSLVYNIGFGDPARKPKPIPGLKTSTVLKRHRLKNYMGAANAFLMWNKDNGVVVRGLMRRREAERKLYLL